MEKYLADHLRKYIKHHLEYGYDYESIKKCLTKYGYKGSEIDKITKPIRFVERKVTKKYSENEMDEETYFYLRGLLSDYMKRQMDHGFELDDIKKALKKYGHPEKLVDDSARLLEKRETVRPSVIFGFSFALMLIFTLIMSLALGVSFKAMFLVFSPTLVMIVLSYFYMKYLKKYTPIASLVGTIVLFMAIFPRLEETSADSSVLLVINAVATFILTGAYLMSE